MNIKELESRLVQLASLEKEALTKLDAVKGTEVHSDAGVAERDNAQTDLSNAIAGIQRARTVVLEELEVSRIRLIMEGWEKVV